MSMHLCVSVCLCVYLKSNSLDMFEGRTTLTKLLRFAFLHAHVLYVRVFGYSRCMCGCMIVQMQHIAAHTLSTKHGGRRGQICNNCAYAYLMDTCVALQYCMCVVRYIVILSPAECKWIHSGLVHKRVRSWMCVVSCTYIATKGVCIMHVRVQLDRR